MAHSLAKAQFRSQFFFAQACGADLFILHAMESNPEFDTLASQTVAKREVDIKNHIEEIKKMAENENIKTTSIIKRTDEIEKTIVDEAKNNEVDVLLMGRRGRKGLKKVFMGAVTERVLTNSPCKVLVVPKDFMIKGETIVLATDGSPCSTIAQKEAVSMVGRCDFLKNIIVISAAKNESELPEAKKLVENVKKQITDVNKKIQVECIAETGRSHKIILEKSAKTNADIIIMGKYGKSALETLFIGSTTEEVIALSPCSVMVVK